MVIKKNILFSYSDMPLALPCYHISGEIAKTNYQLNVLTPNHPKIDL